MSGENDTWEFYQDKAGKHRWRRIAPNGYITGAALKGFTAKSDCEANAERHGHNGNPKGLGKHDKWAFYTDKSKGHRWRRQATNGEIVGASGIAFTGKKTAQENAERNGWLR